MLRMILIALTAFTCPLLSADEIHVNKTKAPTLDGSFGADEWAGANTLQISAETSELYICQDKKNYYFGIKQKSPAIVSLFFQVKDRIYVLHSSAQLGVAVYTLDGKRWTLKSGFKYSPNSDEFYKKNGWRASVASDGDPSQVEFMIKRSLIGRKDVRFSVGCLILAGAKATTSPQVEDDTRNTRLLMGHTPDSLSFQPDRWHRLNPGKAKRK